MIVDTVEFVRTAVGGVVHVLDHYLAWDQAAKVDGELEVVTTVRPVAVCGRQGRPGVEDVVDEFDTRELCPSCWLTTPPHHRPRLRDELVDGAYDVPFILRLVDGELLCEPCDGRHDVDRLVMGSRIVPDAHLLFGELMMQPERRFLVLTDSQEYADAVLKMLEGMYPGASERITFQVRP
jgi:hypothetical protein